MSNRYSKVFALAKALNITHEELRIGAASYSGKQSLRSLDNRQLWHYADKLQKRKDREDFINRKEIQNKFEPNGNLPESQCSFMLDLVCDIFSNIAQFRGWLQRTFAISHERFIHDTALAKRVVAAMNEMRNRGYKIQ